MARSGMFTNMRMNVNLRKRQRDWVYTKTVPVRKKVFQSPRNIRVRGAKDSFYVLPTDTRGLNCVIASQKKGAASTLG